MKANIFDILRDCPYPGRGIILGRIDGNNALLCYFLMGRSVNSRNRVIDYTDGNFTIRAFDETKMRDPSLIIYTPVRILSTCTVVTNGDQTDTVCDDLLGGGSFEDALRKRRFEPDAPNYTPRISGILYNDGRYKLSILKSAWGNPESCERFFYEYAEPLAGTGHFISTYSADGDPLPSYAGEPAVIEITEAFEIFSDKLWNSLNADNKVSLITMRVPLDNSEPETRVYNKNLGV